MSQSVSCLPAFQQYDCADQFVVRVGTLVAETLKKAIAERGYATLVVSGGSTPAPVFRALSTYALPWDQITIFLADERWVSSAHPDSNERLVRENLLSGPASAATFESYPFSNQSVDCDAAQMEKMFGEKKEPYDMVLLGMGEDGHTASLFPGSSQLQTGLDEASAVSFLALTPTNADHERISMTLPRILNSRHIALLLQGNRKLSVYHKALEGTDIEAMPVRGVLLQQRVPVSVHWYSV